MTSLPKSLEETPLPFSSDEDTRPLLKNRDKYRSAPPTVMVIFGASGDLTARKLVPALYNLSLDGLLPDHFFMIGYGRKPLEDEAFRAFLREAVQKFSRQKLDTTKWEQLAERIFYQAGAYDDAQAYGALAKRINAIEAELACKVQTLFYIATPPNVFQDVLEHLGDGGLSARHSGTDLDSKVIIEKPFGRDLASAQALNCTIARRFAEQQVYRIDHYLGKETVQDLLVQRFANSIFEPIWHREQVECVQITVAEDIGVGGRGGYYDQSGALRDMIQNHTMQLLALVAMEPPISLHPEAIRDEKVKLLLAVQPLKLEPGSGDAVRARYVEGQVQGRKVPGYLQEEGIPKESATETYAALRLSINNWRWEGVPFYLRSGKRLASRVSEIAVRFKRPPGVLFSEGDRSAVANNTMVMRIQPDEGLTLSLNSKVPGLGTHTQPVNLHFRYAATFGSNTPEAYERLILDAMIGDGTLFIRGDETEASWKLITPILDHWQTFGAEGLETYPAGSWGPTAADHLLAQNRHAWRKPDLHLG